MRAVFAIPGDMHRLTGGFVYEFSVLHALRALGHRIDHLQLPESFPDPSEADAARTLALLGEVPADTPILLDGFVPGTVDPGGLAAIRAPLVPIIHHPLGLESGLSPARAAFLLRNERMSLVHAAHMIVPSPHTARQLSEQFAVPAPRITIAPPGFDQRGGERTPAAPPVILAVGIFAERKGHDVLIAALSRLTDLPWQARIVGATHEVRIAEALAGQIQAHGLGDRVTLAGELDPASLRAAYQAASVFALATRYEGYGIVFGEAMLWGLPIVSCASGAVPDTVGDAGRLVPPDDPAAFAAALWTLLCDAGAYRALSRASAQRGTALPRWRDTAGTIAAALEEMGNVRRDHG